MKKKIVATILVILMYVIFASCNSCTSCTPGSAQSVKDTIPRYMDSPINPSDTDTLMLGTYPDLIAENFQDTAQKMIIKKEISKMEIDSTWKLRRDSVYKQLEKTERGLKMQQQTIDSMIVIKKK